MNKLRVTLTAVREYEVQPGWLQRKNHETEATVQISIEQFIAETKESVEEDPFLFIEGDPSITVTVEQLS